MLNAGTKSIPPEAVANGQSVLSYTNNGGVTYEVKTNHHTGGRRSLPRTGRAVPPQWEIRQYRRDDPRGIQTARPGDQ